MLLQEDDPPLQRQAIELVVSACEPESALMLVAGWTQVLLHLRTLTPQGLRCSLAVSVIEPLRRREASYWLEQRWLDRGDMSYLPCSYHTRPEPPWNAGDISFTHRGKRRLTYGFAPVGACGQYGSEVYLHMKFGDQFHKEPPPIRRGLWLSHTGEVLL